MDPLTPRDLFRLTCQAVAREGELRPETRELLRHLQQALGIPPEDARRLLAEGCGRAAREEPGPRPFAPDELMAETCRLAWSDRVLEPEERALLVELGAALGLGEQQVHAHVLRSRPAPLPSEEPLAEAAPVVPPGESSPEELARWDWFVCVGLFWSGLLGTLLGVHVHEVFLLAGLGLFAGPGLGLQRARSIALRTEDSAAARFVYGLTMGIPTGWVAGAYGLELVARASGAWRQGTLDPARGFGYLVAAALLGGLAFVAAASLAHALGLVGGRDYARLTRFARRFLEER